MGQKLIITEEEKNRIKLLYEASPPPSESIFIANKNPFKYDEYSNARQLYSSHLKDGDFYYQPINTEKYITYRDQYNKRVVNELIKSVLGKSIRYNDSIYVIEKVTDDNIVTIKNTDLNGALEAPADLFHSSYLGGYTLNVYYPTIREPFISTPLNGLAEKDYKKLLPYSISDNKEIPDEYFEIRQIKRQKTDY